MLSMQVGKLYRVAYHIGNFTDAIQGRFDGEYRGRDEYWAMFFLDPPFGGKALVRAANIVTIFEIPEAAP